VSPFCRGTNLDFFLGLTLARLILGGPHGCGSDQKLPCRNIQLNHGQPTGRLGLPVLWFVEWFAFTQPIIRTQLTFGRPFEGQIKLEFKSLLNCTVAPTLDRLDEVNYALAPHHRIYKQAANSHLRGIKPHSAQFVGGDGLVPPPIPNSPQTLIVVPQWIRCRPIKPCPLGAIDFYLKPVSAPFRLRFSRIIQTKAWWDGSNVGKVAVGAKYRAGGPLPLLGEIVTGSATY